MQTVSPFLWFDGQAEEAARFYLSVFKNSRIDKIARNPPSTPGETGTVMIVTFTLDGQEFTALNGGPQFKFNLAVSFVASCEDQTELDRLWETLSAGGEKGQCGWLKDRYGLSWQVFPSIIPELLAGDPAGADRVMQAVMGMTKLDIAAIEAAYKG